MNAPVRVPVETAHLFAPLDEALLELLRGLSADDWRRPTAAGGWTVFDVAAHLLDGSLRKLSFHRDAPPGQVPAPPADYATVLRIVDDLNAQWIAAARRLSPAVLVGMIAHTSPQLAAFVESLDPHADARFGVAWAGEDRSANWLDTAREYTERWHHQQQIREAVDAPGLTSRRWLHPVIDVSMEALRRTYRDVNADDGTAIDIEVDGEAGGRWQVTRAAGRWRILREIDAAARGRASIRVPDGIAWRMFFKQVTSDAARAAATVTGDAALAEPFFAARAVMV